MNADLRGSCATRSGLFLERVAQQPMKGFQPQIPLHVAHLLSLSAALGMDFLSSGRRSTPFPPDLCRTPDRLHAQPGRLGHSCRRSHSSRGALDHLLQTDRAGECLGRRLVHPIAAIDAKGFSKRTGQPDHRRYAGSPLRKEGAGDQHQTRSQPQGQPAHLCEAALRAVPANSFSEQPRLGHTGSGGAGPIGFGADHPDSFLVGRRIRPTRQTLGGAAVDRVGQGECPRSASADRCLVHAQEFDSASARTEGAHHWSGATGYGPLSAAGAGTETPGAETKIRATARYGHAGYIASARNGSGAVRQNAVGQIALDHCRGTIPEGTARAGGVVRDPSGRQHLVASAPDSGDRDGIVGSGRGGNLRRALGYRAFVSQPEAMVGCGKPVATIEGGAGTVDADPFHSLRPDAIARPEVVGILSVDGNRALAQGNNDHGGAFRSVDANQIYRTSRAPCLQPEVGEFRDAFSSPRINDCGVEAYNLPSVMVELSCFCVRPTPPLEKIRDDWERRMSEV